MTIKSVLNQKKNSIKLGVATLATAAGIFAPALVNADSYTVQSGDTLSSIAATHQTSVDSLVSLNQLTDANILSVGQVLELSSTAGTATTNSSSTSSTTEVATTSSLSAADAEAKEWIAQKESSGSYTAQNGQYYGRYQLTISYLNGDLSPENQEKVADNYVTSRYGSWSAAKLFWLANGWY